jgi:hypothetical protein
LNILHAHPKENSPLFQMGHFSSNISLAGDLRLLVHLMLATVGTELLQLDLAVDALLALRVLGCVDVSCLALGAAKPD